MTANGYGILGGSDRSVLKSGCNDVCTTLNILKPLNYAHTF